MIQIIAFAVVFVTYGMAGVMSSHGDVANTVFYAAMMLGALLVFLHYDNKKP